MNAGYLSLMMRDSVMFGQKENKHQAVYMAHFGLTQLNMSYLNTPWHRIFKASCTKEEDLDAALVK